MAKETAMELEFHLKLVDAPEWSWELLKVIFMNQKINNFGLWWLKVGLPFLYKFNIIEKAA